MLSLNNIKKAMVQDRKSYPVNDFHIDDSWVEYDTDSRGNDILKYFCFIISVIDPETGEKKKLYKALNFVRVHRIPKSARQSTSFMDMQAQVLSAVYDQKMNLVTLVANMIRPVPEGLMFLYGIQGTGTDMGEAKKNCDSDMRGFIAAMMGTFRVLDLKFLSKEEALWLREKMRGMRFLTAVRGLPKANTTGEDIGNKGVGGTNLNPDSEGTMEELITAMADYEYVIEVLSTPVQYNTLVAWQSQTQKQMTEWNEQLQGTKSLSMNLSIPMTYMTSTGNSKGWSKNYTDSRTVSYTNSESFSNSYTENVGKSLSHSLGESFGTTQGHSVTNSDGENYSVSQGVTKGHTTGTTEGLSHGTTIGETIGETFGTTKGYTHGTTSGSSAGFSIAESNGSNQGTSTGVNSSTSSGTNMSENSSHSVSSGTSSGTSQSSSTSQNASITRGENVSANESFSSGINSSTSHTAGTSETATYGSSNTRTVSGNHSEGTNWTQGTSHADGGSKGTGSSSNWNAGLSDGDSRTRGFTANTPEYHGIGASGNASWSDSNGSNFSLSSGTSSSSSTSWNDSTSRSSGGSSSDGYSWSEANGTSESNSAGKNESFSASTGNSYSESYGLAYGQSQSQSMSSGTSESWGTTNGVNNSQSDSTGISTGSSYSSSNGSSYGTNQGTSYSVSVTQNGSQSTSSSMSESISTSESTSHSTSTSENSGTSYSQSVSDSMSSSQTESNGTSSSVAIGQSDSESYTRSISDGTGESWGESTGTSTGTSSGTSTGTSQGTSVGTSGSYTTGTSGTMGIGPSVGYSKSYQWLDQQVKDILELLEYQNERLKMAIRGNGAFYTYVYIACNELQGLYAAQAAAKSTWQNETAKTQPLQILDLENAEQDHLLYHFKAFSADVTREVVAGISDYKYATVLLPKEYVAYTHLPRISEGGIDTNIEDIPKFRVPGLKRGGIYMGTQLNAERYTFKNGYRTQFDYRIDIDELMHGMFVGQSRSGKTVAAMRFVAELANMQRTQTGKRLRIVIMDPKQDWRGIARFVDSKRFRFYSLGNTHFQPISFNPCKIPKGVVPQHWIDGIINIYCRSYGLLERGKQMLAGIFYELYDEAGCFEAWDSRNYTKEAWDAEISKRSAQITFHKVYLSMKAKDTANKVGKTGNDTLDAYARLVERLSCFSRSYSIEYQLFSKEAMTDGSDMSRLTEAEIENKPRKSYYGTGLGIDELIGADDITVFESFGLESTFANFIFGVITSGFYKVAKSKEGGFLHPDEYETVLVIEEANKVLTGNDTAGKGGSGMPSLSGQSEFEEILDQSAGYGLFITAITQKPSQMPSSIIANCGMLFIGKLSQPEDVDLSVRMIGREGRLDDRDVTKWFPKSPTGWFICRSNRGFDFRDAEPVLVQIEKLNIGSLLSNLELEEILMQKRLP